MSNEQSADDLSWQQQLLQHAGNLPEVAVSLCDAFLYEVPNLLTKIARCLDSGQVDGLHTAIHTLKSCLNYVASPEELRLAAELESRCKKADVAHDANFVADFAQLSSISRDWVNRVRDFRMDLEESA